MFDATEVVPINFVFFTASAIVAGVSTIKRSLPRKDKNEQKMSKKMHTEI